MTGTVAQDITLAVEFSPTTAPLATPSWVDITDKVFEASGITINRGRSSVLDQFTAGSASFVLDNRNRLFDPEYAAGTYYGDLLPLRRFRISATHNAVTYRRFTGFCLGWPQQYDVADARPIVPIQLVDAFDVLAGYELVGTPLEAWIRNLEPVNWYKLDEPEGSSQAVDSGSDRRVLTAYGSITFGDNPIAVGSTSADFSTSGHLNGAPAAATVDGSGTDRCTVFSIRTSSSGDIFTVTGHPRLAINGSGFVDVGAAEAFVGSTDVADGDEHFVLTFYDDSANEGTVWVDGVEESGLTVTSSGLAGVGDESSFVGKGDHDLAQVATWDSDITANEADLFDAYGGWSGDTTGERIARILELVGVASADQDIATGLTSLGTDSALTGSALSYVQLMATTEAGSFFVAGDGKVTFRDRHWRLTATAATTSQATFGEGAAEYPYGSIELSYDRDRIVNDATVTGTGVVVGTKRDTASALTYGVRSVSVSTAHTDVNEVRSQAEWIVDRFADPQLRVERLNVPLHRPVGDKSFTRNDFVADVFGLDVGHLVTVNRRPGGGTVIEKDEHVEGIAERLNHSEWWVDLFTSPADVRTYWELGVATLGIDTVLAF